MTMKFNNSIAVLQPQIPHFRGVEIKAENC